MTGCEMMVWLWVVAAWAEGGVVINELVPDAVGADAGAEWVELLGVEAAPVDLTGWTLQRATQPGSWSTVFELPEGTWIAPGERLVLAGPEADLPDGETILWLPPGAELGNAGSSSDAVALVNAAGTAVDVVVYGSANAPGDRFLDEEGVPVETDRLAPSPKSGLALARVPDGLDTGSGTDFVRQDPSPAEPNASTEAPSGGPCVPARPGEVLLNELLADPEGGDAGAEWVELRSHLGEALPLDGWSLQTAGRPADWGSAARTHRLDGLVLPAGGHAVRVDDGERPLALGNAQDALRLVDCEGTVIDEVVYGGRNPDGFLDADGEPYPDDAVAPALRSGLSLARAVDGVSTQNAAVDWLVATEATPGEPNPTSVCEPGVGVVINELLPDARGPDAASDAEWVELYAVGDAVDLAGWSLVRQTSGASGPSVLHSFHEGVVPAGGWWVIGGSLTPANAVVPFFDLPSGSGVDALMLVDCAGSVVDTVLYGGPNADRLAEDGGRVPDRAAPDPAEGQCVARDDDGLDRDRSAKDFVTTSRCTPGAPNRDRHSEPEAAEEALTAGCGGGGRLPQGSGGSTGGCAQGGSPALAWLLLPWLLRRRLRGSADRLPGCSGSPRW